MQIPLFTRKPFLGFCKYLFVKNNLIFVEMTFVTYEGYTFFFKLEISRKCAVISAHYGMSNDFDNLIISLCKFTTLITTSEVCFGDFTSLLPSVFLHLLVHNFNSFENLCCDCYISFVSMFSGRLLIH